MQTKEQITITVDAEVLKDVREKIGLIPVSKYFDKLMKRDMELI